MPDVVEQVIADDVMLLRRIRPDQIVDDENTGERRPSSAAFKDPELSVDAELILIANGLDWKFSLKGHPDYSLAQFTAADARAKELQVLHKPINPGNPAHTEICGKKTQGIANHLRNCSAWRHLEPKIP